MHPQRGRAPAGEGARPPTARDVLDVAGAPRREADGLYFPQGVRNESCVFENDAGCVLSVEQTEAHAAWVLGAPAPEGSGRRFEPLCALAPGLHPLSAGAGAAWACAPGLALPPAGLTVARVAACPSLAALTSSGGAGAGAGAASEAASEAEDAAVASRPLDFLLALKGHGIRLARGGWLTDAHDTLSIVVEQAPSLASLEPEAVTERFARVASEARGARARVRMGLRMFKEAVADLQLLDAARDPAALSLLARALALSRRASAAGLPPGAPLDAADGELGAAARGGAPLARNAFSQPVPHAAPASHEGKGVGGGRDGSRMSTRKLLMRSASSLKALALPAGAPMARALREGVLTTALADGGAAEVRVDAKTGALVVAAPSASASASASTSARAGGASTRSMRVLKPMTRIASWTGLGAASSDADADAAPVPAPASASATARERRLSRASCAGVERKPGRVVELRHAGGPRLAFVSASDREADELAAVLESWWRGDGAPA